MIERTKTVVESQFSIANGRQWDARVIYGDTDSVMVEFGCDDLETAMELGREFQYLPFNTSLSILRARSGCIRHRNRIRATHQSGIREGVFPISSHQQETICRTILDKAR